MIIVRLSRNNNFTRLKIIMYHNNPYTNQYTSQHLFIMCKFSISIISQFIRLLSIISSLTSPFLKLLNIPSKIIQNLIKPRIIVSQLRFKNNKSHLINKVTGSNPAINHSLKDCLQSHTNNLMIHLWLLDKKKMILSQKTIWKKSRLRYYLNMKRPWGTWTNKQCKNFVRFIKSIKLS